jgi:ribosomal subunit interface protein
MQLTITSRHEEVPEALRTRAEVVVSRLARFAHRPTHAQVEFSLDHHRATAELRLHAARGTVHVASAEAGDHRTALDRAAAKLRRQLDKKATGHGRGDAVREE